MLLLLGFQCVEAKKQDFLSGESWTTMLLCCQLSLVLFHNVIVRTCLTQPTSFSWDIEYVGTIFGKTKDVPFYVKYMWVYIYIYIYGELLYQFPHHQIAFSLSFFLIIKFPLLTFPLFSPKKKKIPQYYNKIIIII